MNNFEHHWATNTNDLVADKKKDVAKKFLMPVLDEINQQEGLRILDAGCGDGVHAEALAECDGVFRYSGIDVSQNAVTAASNRVSDERFDFSVEDILSTSFDSNAFDIVFSYGVIAYTKSPRKVMVELARITKGGGMTGIWIYPKPKGLLGVLFRMTQWICVKGGGRIAYHIANLIVPFMRFLPVSSGVHLGNATWQQCREVVLVNIAPLQLAFPERSEIVGWFSDAGLEIIKEDLDDPVTIWAVKK